MISPAPLKRFCTVIAGQSPPSDLVSEFNDDLPFLQGNAEFGEVWPEARFSCASAPKIALPGDILLSVRAPVGALNIADRRYGIGRGLCAIRARRDVSSRYLWWALHAALPMLHESAVGSTYNAVTADEVRELRVLMGPLKDQHRVAAYLDQEITRVGALTANKRKMMELLENRLKSLAGEVTVGREGGLKTGIPSLPEIPSSWRVLRNKVFMREVNRRSPDGSGEMLSVSHITGVTPRSEKTVYMFEAESTVGYKIVRPGNLVINTMWAWMGAAGTARTVGIVSPAYGVYTIDKSVMLPEFFDILVRTPAYVTEMTRFSRGVTSSRLRLYPEEFLALSSPVPPIELQTEIAERYRAESAATRETCDRLVRQIELLEERRQALITAAVIGKLDIPGVSV